MAAPSVIEFNRPKKFALIGALGHGACGETLHIRDEDMDFELVVKKYRPMVSEEENPALFGELLNRFRDEARILFRLNHPNVVRVYNFYDYSEQKTAYILMEYVSGQEILDYLQNHRSHLARVFEGVVQGFVHLQSRNVLHRDIRPANILVDEDGLAKVIDFGFGKQTGIEAEPMDQKSISLNWWCETPPEFSEGRYDHQTEVYFVGKLFEKALLDHSIDNFKYRDLVASMCLPNRTERTKSFADVQRRINEDKFSELSFTEEEAGRYRVFASELTSVVSSIDPDARCENDSEKILRSLKGLYRKTQLELDLSAPNELARVFIDGGFRYWKNANVQVATIRDFIDLLETLAPTKREILVENLLFRLDAIERTKPEFDDEIPF